MRSPGVQQALIDTTLPDFPSQKMAIISMIVSSSEDLKRLPTFIPSDALPYIRYGESLCYRLEFDLR